MSAASAKMKAAKMKADAKKKAAKMKAGSPTKKTGTPKTGYKYERIESKSEMPKFKMEKEKKVKMKKKDLKLKKESPNKMKDNNTKKRNKTLTGVKRGGKVYKYKSEDSDRKIKGKDIASKNKSTKRKQTIKNKNVAKGEVKKTKSKDRVGVMGTTKVKVKGGKNRVLKTEADYRAEAARKSPMNMSGRSYDMKMAYDKKLTPKARLHYLENERHDKDSAMKMGSPYEKHGSPYHKHGSPYHKHGSPYHMGYKDSPMNKELVGKQHNLPEHLKKKIEAAPEMKGSPYHMSNELKYGGPVIDQMKTLSQAGSFKVLKHMKSKI